MPERTPVPVTLLALARVALEAGVVGFGGGLSIIAVLRRSVVDERGWLTQEEFVARIGVAGGLPGTMATNLIALVGYRLRGLWGGVVAPLVLVTPGCIAITLLAVWYDRIHGSTLLRAALDGMVPAVAGLFAAVAVELGRGTLRALRDWLLAGVAAVCLSAGWLSLVQVVVLAGLLGVVRSRGSRAAAAVAPWPLAGFLASTPLWLTILGVFSKIGLVTFGGGAAMYPAIAAEAIGRGWIDERTFADAVVLGQVTPGPVGVSATFIGYRVLGLVGAFVASVGIFVPPVALTLGVARSLRAFEQSAWLHGFLAGVRPAVVGILVAAAYAVARPGVHGALDVGILVVCAAWRIFRPTTSALSLLAAGAAVGLARALVR